MNCFINTYYAYTKFIPTDIYPVQYGEEQCNRNHSFGPCVRSNYLLHYVYSGKGIFQTENNTYHLHKGQMFHLYRQISLHIIKPMTATLGCIDGLNLTEVCRSQF